MFRHKPSADAPAVSAPVDAPKPETIDKSFVKKESAFAGPEDLRDLVEKNLKWSQIIYEQNRKINNKLLWAAVASWIKLLILLGSIAAAVIFLPPMLKGVFSQYSQLLGNISTGGDIKNPIDNLMKLFNLDSAKQEQLKTLLK